MDKKYRVDWQAGMRLTEATFRQTDDYYASCLQPIYALMAVNGYGFLEVPVIRYELNDVVISFTELQAKAITYSGKLINIYFNKEERNLFQNIALPNTTSPVILFLDITSNKTVSISNSTDVVPLCDGDYKIIAKEETEHYSNPDAVPFARFVYNRGWEMDNSFIAPCIYLRANGQLLRFAANYVAELEALMNKLKEFAQSAQRDFVRQIVSHLAKIATEVEKEADAMSPRHFICLMQQAIQIILTLADLENDVIVPEHEACKAYVESHFTSYITSHLIQEGLRLTHALMLLPESFDVSIAPPELEPEPERPARRVDTSSIRKKFH